MSVNAFSNRYPTRRGLILAKLTGGGVCKNLVIVRAEQGVKARGWDPNEFWGGWGYGGVSVVCNRQGAGYHSLLNQCALTRLHVDNCVTRRQLND